MIAEEASRQLDATMAWNRQQSENQLSIARSGLAAARASSDADREARIAAAQMQLEAAQYAADKAFAASQLDSETRLKIAQMDNATQLRYIEAQIAAKGPGGWTERAYWMRSQQPPTPAPATTPAATPAAQVQPSAAVMTGQQPPTVAADYQRWANVAQPRASQAIVGEQGPELATATPQGTQITPLRQPGPIYSLPKNRTFQGPLPTPRMALGGTIALPWNRTITEANLRSTRPTTTGGATPTQTRTKSQQIREGKTGVKGTSYTAPVGEMGLWGGTGSRRQPNFAGVGRHFVTGQGWQQAPAGGYGVSGNPPRSIEPAFGGSTGQGIAGTTGTTADTSFQNMPWLRYIQEGTKPAGFGAWGGSQTSKLGYDIKPPHTMNLNYFLQLNPDEQQMALAAWQDVYGYTPEAAFELMRRAAPLGSGTAMAGYR
jgi:hypothetical protein